MLYVGGSSYSACQKLQKAVGSSTIDLRVATFAAVLEVARSEMSEPATPVTAIEADSTVVTNVLKCMLKECMYERMNE